VGSANFNGIALREWFRLLEAFRELAMDELR